MRRRTLTAVVATVIGLLVSGLVTAAPARASQGGYVEIVNAISQKCADVNHQLTTPGAIVWQWDCHNDANQLWLPVDLGNGYKQYVNMNSGLCLNVRGGDAAAVGAFIEQQYCDGQQRSQWWRWLGADDIGHLVLNSGLGNYCLALDGVFSARNGWFIVIHDCATTGGQMWRAG